MFKGVKKNQCKFEDYWLVLYFLEVVVAKLGAPAVYYVSTDVVHDMIKHNVTEIFMYVMIKLFTIDQNILGTKEQTIYKIFLKHQKLIKHCGNDCLR